MGQGGASMRAAPEGSLAWLRRRRDKDGLPLITEPQFTAFLDKNAVVSATTSPEGFAAFLKEDRKAAEILIKIANAKREQYDPATTK